jgi:hypothetical protein
MASYRVFAYPKDSEQPRDIAFQRLKDVPVDSEDVAFAGEVTSSLRVLKRLTRAKEYWADETFRLRFNELLSAAQGAVRHPDGDRISGLKVLELFRESIIDDLGKPARKRFLGATSLCAAVLIAIGIYLLGWAYQNAEPYLPSPSNNMEPYFTTAGAAILGISFSVWLANVLKVQNLTWSSLEYLDPGGFSPAFRYLIVMVITVILMAVLHRKWVILGAGGDVLNDFLGNVTPSFIVGLLCGMAEVPVVQLIRALFDRAATPQTN